MNGERATQEYIKGYLKKIGIDNISIHRTPFIGGYN